MRELFAYGRTFLMREGFVYGRTFLFTGGFFVCAEGMGNAVEGLRKEGIVPK